MDSQGTNLPGYTYGTTGVLLSPVSLPELAALKITVGWAETDDALLRLAGDVLERQTEQIVAHWRSGIIASIPHLARHSRSPAGTPLPDYLAHSNRRFEQWILDTCRRPYDQDWLNYQHEIALRHTSVRKNQTDRVASTPFVPFRDIIAFTVVMNQTIKPYLAAAHHPAETVEQMHQAWCKSLQLQIALWARVYTDPAIAPEQW